MFRHAEKSIKLYYRIAGEGYTAEVDEKLIEKMPSR